VQRSTNSATIGARDGGEAGEVILTISTPHPSERNGVPIWKGGYAFGPPVAISMADKIVGVDFVQVFVASLRVARGCLEGEFPDGRVQWQGRTDCGLPWRTSGKQSSQVLPIPTEEPSDSNVRTLATRTLGYRDEHGTTQRVTLSIFEPIEASDRSWKCGVAFDHVEGAPLRYGRGRDAIEAMLDALAIARRVFAAMTAKGSSSEEGDWLDCEDLPQKIDGGFELRELPQ
jgi:hypothetical protein